MTAGEATEPPRRRTRRTGTFPRTLSRVFRYTVVRLVAILAAVVIAVFLTIFVANLGGYVDDIVRSQIDETIAARVQGGWLRDKPADVRFEISETRSGSEARQKRSGAGPWAPGPNAGNRWASRRGHLAR